MKILIILALALMPACNTPPAEPPGSVGNVPEAAAAELALGKWRCGDGPVNATLVMENITLELGADGAYVGTIDFHDIATGVSKRWHAVNHGRYTIADGTICFVHGELSMTAQNAAAKETDEQLEAGGEPTLEESIRSRVPSGQKDCYPIQELSAQRLNYGTVCER